VIARKLILVRVGDALAGTITNLPNITNEMSAIKKICMAEHTHKNIVHVFNCGQLRQFWYFIDMELCDMNLECWIYRTWDVTTAEKLPFFTENDISSPEKMRQAWEIMRDVSDAVSFIHSEGLIHRDLKPSNSKGTLFEPWLITFSFIFSQRQGLESWGFRPHDGRLVKQSHADV
jgi:serine/threonine protein kinase